MKRDMGLVRKLLLHIEEHQVSSSLQSTAIAIDGYNSLELEYHLRLMVEANLIDYSVDTTSHDDARAGRIFSCIIRGITWEGHDLLDAIRNDTVWSRTLEKIKPLESVAVDVLKQVAVGISLKILGV